MKKSFFPDTITLYNKAKGDRGQDEWYRTVLDGCYWVKETVKTATDNNAASISSNISVRILQRQEYKSPSEWVKDEPGFTLNVGDLILLGEHDVQITGTGEFTVSAIKSKYGGIEIKAVHIWDKPFMKNKHYRVLGV